MHFPSFPIFALETINAKVVAGGGGGDEKYGKENGILVFDTNLLPIAYYKTADVIRSLQVCSRLALQALEVDSEDSSGKHRSRKDSASDGGEGAVEDMEKNTEDGDLSASSESVCLESRDAKAVDKNGVKSSQEDLDLERSSRTRGRSPGDAKTKPDENRPLRGTESDVLMRPIYICASGMKSLYLLKLEHVEFELLCKVDIKTTFLLFDGRVHFVSQKELFALVEDPGNGSEKATKYKQKSLGRSGLQSFYIQSDRIHLIHDKAPTFYFYFGGVRISVRDLKGVSYTPQTGLVFYQNNLASIDGKSFNIKKISCVKPRNDFVAIGTGDGQVFVIKNKRVLRRMSLGDLPITSVDVCNGMLFYSTLVGVVGKQKLRDNRLYFLVAFLVLLFLLAVAKTTLF